MNKNKTEPGIVITQFGTLADGQEVLKYTLKNKNNLKLSLTSSPPVRYTHERGFLKGTCEVVE